MVCIGKPKSPHDLAQLRKAGIMTGAIGEVANQAFMALCLQPHLHDRADPLDHIDVALLVAAADIVFFSEPAPRRDEMKGSGMVLDIEPIAGILAP